MTVRRGDVPAGGTGTPLDSFGRGVFLRAAFVRRIDNLAAAVLLCQILWHFDGADYSTMATRDGETWLTAPRHRWEAEIGLSARQVQRAEQVLELEGLIACKTWHVDRHPTRHLRPRREAIEALLRDDGGDQTVKSQMTKRSSVGDQTVKSQMTKRSNTPLFETSLRELEREALPPPLRFPIDDDTEALPAVVEARAAGLGTEYLEREAAKMLAWHRKKGLCSKDWHANFAIWIWRDLAYAKSNNGSSASRAADRDTVTIEQSLEPLKRAEATARARGDVVIDVEATESV